ncbi:MAG: FAD-dependent oxidoreductase, partial [Bdellovibrionales bacterium]|nr:FAD-dependent oxidoreductase [Bdellovibrionales bacterium]
MKSQRKNILVVGGGITGLTAAVQLSKNSNFSVTLVESGSNLGGMARGVWFNGGWADTGSHRIHPNYEPRAMRIIMELLGDSILTRPRNGLIRTGGRFCSYPPNGLEILTSCGGARKNLSAAFALGACYFRTAIAGNRERTFESYAIRELGSPLYRRFYEPYARKLWGVDPRNLSHEPAKSRTARFRPKILMQRTVQKFGLKQKRPTYLYPRGGFGQIVTRLSEQANLQGVRFLMKSEVRGVLSASDSDMISSANIFERESGLSQTLSFDAIVWTAPLSAMSRLEINDAEKEPSKQMLSW